MKLFKEFIKESKEHRFKKGDRVVVNGNVDSVYFQQEPGIIIEEPLYDGPGEYGYVCIEFDKSISEISDGEHRGHEGYGTGKYGHCWNVPTNKVTLNYRKFTEDDIEDSNMEEWIEESNERKKYVVGDKVRCIYPYSKNKNKSGKIVYSNVGIIIIQFDDGTFESFGSPTCIEPIEDTKTSHYEEWIEEEYNKKEHEFEIGDLVKVHQINSSWDNHRCRIISILSGGRYRLKRLSDGQEGTASTVCFDLLDDDTERTNYEEWAE